MNPNTDAAAAVASLRPDAEFVLRGGEVEVIEWITPGVAPITQAEVDAEMARLEAEAEANAQARTTARAAALAKLAALGLTVDDLSALGL